MSSFSHLALSVLALCGIFVFLRRLFFSHRHSLKKTAEIIHIKLSQVDQLFSPEVEVIYQFSHEDEVYQGRDFLRIDELLGGESFLLTNRNGFAVLNTSDASVVGEEHIETYLLQRQKLVDIEYNARGPEENRLVKTGSSYLLQSFSIDFPWQKKQ